MTYDTRFTTVLCAIARAIRLSTNARLAIVHGPDTSGVHRTACIVAGQEAFLTDATPDRIVALQETAQGQSFSASLLQSLTADGTAFGMAELYFPPDAPPPPIDVPALREFALASGRTLRHARNRQLILRHSCPGLGTQTRRRPRRAAFRLDTARPRHRSCDLRHPLLKVAASVALWRYTSYVVFGWCAQAAFTASLEDAHRRASNVIGKARRSAAQRFPR